MSIIFGIPFFGSFVLLGIALTWFLLWFFQFKEMTPTKWLYLEVILIIGSLLVWGSIDKLDDSVLSLVRVLCFFGSVVLVGSFLALATLRLLKYERRVPLWWSVVVGLFGLAALGFFIVLIGAMP